MDRAVGRPQISIGEHPPAGHAGKGSVSSYEPSVNIKYLKLTLSACPAGRGVGGEEVASGFEARTFGGHGLIAPAVVGLKPRGAKIVVGGAELFEPAVEAEVRSGERERFGSMGEEPAEKFERKK